MKRAGKFDKWIDHSIARLMELTDDKNLLKLGESPEVRKESFFLSLPSNAEASDFLSINEWMNPQD